MRQVVLAGPRTLEHVEAAAPEPAAGELLVEVKAAAICGTDVHIYAGHTPVGYPRVMGHEVAGVITRLGEGVRDFDVGDPVILNPNLSCGRCNMCVRGKENICVSTQLLGREVDGCLREQLTIPAANAFKLPGHLDFAEAPLIQPLSTVAHAQRLAAITPGESVAVLGQGASGLMHTRLSKLAGAGPLMAIGRSAWKLDLAKRMEADVVIGAADVDPVAEVKRHTDGLGADVVIEAVGGAEMFAQAMQMVKAGGRVISFGISPQPLPELRLLDMYLREMTVMFPRAMTAGDFRRSVELVESRQIDLRPLVTREFALGDASDALRFAEEEQSNNLRVVIRP